MSNREIGVVFAILLVTACTKERDDNTVKEFFQRGSIGESDAALLRKSDLTGNWDYVATVHGMVYPSDMDICQSIVEAFRQKYPEAEYSCTPLN